MDITAAAIATLISSGVASLVAVSINKANGKKSLHDQLDSIIKIAIQYPYLENQAFTSTWTANKESDDERYLRYENYCTLVFNYLERLCKFYKYDTKKIESHLNVKGWIRVHEQCWHNPSEPYENKDGYEQQFKEILESYLR